MKRNDLWNTLPPCQPTKCNEKVCRCCSLQQSEVVGHKFVCYPLKYQQNLFLKESAECYNWDDGFELPLAVVKNVLCDKGTAFSLFWLAEGIVWYTGEVQKNDYNDDWSEFCK